MSTIDRKKFDNRAVFVSGGDPSFKPLTASEMWDAADRIEADANSGNVANPRRAHDHATNLREVAILKLELGQE
jgi:hypothetical protein